MAKNPNKTISIKFPFGDDTENGKYFKMNTLTNEDVKSSLYFFITSRKGERWYDPDFGTRLEEFLFEPNDQLTEDEITISLKTDIAKYFKNVTILDIQYIKSDNDRQLDIFIYFTFQGNFNIYEDNLQIVFKFN